MIVDLDNINEVVNTLEKLIKEKNIVVLLQGDLASGKTTLVKNYLKAIGCDDKVTSPTFSIQSIYGNNIYHYDVYNKTLEEFISLGLLEEFEKDGIHFVEWGDENLKKILDDYGFEVLVVKINKLNEKREYIIGS
ncbi:MAG: tRNA (adenosine(37)-N6)-threonylcarbamoyltransferase complex ATPase subunit type 1 TsaE [Arcobacteraceae bacterium]|nr:tRNA (adenosine(37)-N6)-threonylcarbamoyltransferase complex ATPase subunit type 1 TsaE [Arcobacteraceae bacterium]